MSTAVTLSLPNHITSLATAGILVSVDVKVWTGTKADNRIASEVSANANAKTKVGKWSHDLLAGDADLKSVLNHRQTVYNFLERWTYDWMGKLRYLPSVNIAEFKAGYDALQVEFAALTDKFLESYDDKVAAQAFNRGAFFSRSDYPSIDELRSRFGMALYTAEVPTGDFRVQIANDLASDMRNSLQKQMEEQINNIHAKQVAQLREVVESISHCCATEVVTGKDGETKVRRRKIYDSTLQKALTLCDTFADFNLKQDPVLEDIRASLYASLRDVSVDTLRESDTLRDKMKEDADSILSKFI